MDEDARLIFVGEYAREVQGIGTYQPGQRTRLFLYPAEKKTVEYLLSTGLFQPFDEEAATIVREVVEELRQKAEAEATAEKEHQEKEAAEKEEEAKAKVEAEALEAEEIKPVPPEALERLRDRYMEDPGQEGVS